MSGPLLQYRTFADRKVGLDDVRTRTDQSITNHWWDVELMRRGEQLIGYREDALSVVDLETGKRQVLHIPDSRFQDGYLTGIGNNRFVVLARSLDQGDADHTMYLVVDLRTGWSRAYPRIEPGTVP